MPELLNGLQTLPCGIKRQNGWPTNYLLSRRWDSLIISSSYGISFVTAHEQGIMTGPGRGSSAGSLVAYVLNITMWIR